MGYGLLGSVFNFLDPILDEIDPIHNPVQTWTIGSSTTKGQRPYFETIAPLIVDAFLPGVGSAIGAVDKGSTGNWGGAALSALGSYAQLGSVGSAASTGASGGVAATEAAPALTSTAGNAGGSVVAAGDDAVSIGNAVSAADYGSDAATYADASNFGAANTFGQTPTNDVGLLGMSSTSGAPSSTQFMAMPTSQFSSAAGVGGVGQGLEGTSAAAVSSAGARPWYSNLNTPSTGKMAGVLGEQMLKQEAQKQKMAEEQKMRAQQAMGSVAGDPGGGPARSYSIQKASPYAQFEGGFNPKRYGANVRNRGLLG